MAILKSCFSISNTQILASVVPNSNNNSQPISKPSIKPQKPQNTKNNNNNIKKKNRSQQPSIIEIERAIGAGAFREPDIFRRLESNNSHAEEWAAEKKLREVGEWLLENTENNPNTNSGKEILKTIYFWILPVWIIVFLVAARIIELPFNSSFLDDLLL